MVFADALRTAHRKNGLGTLERAQLISNEAVAVAGSLSILGTSFRTRYRRDGRLTNQRSYPGAVASHDPFE